MLSNAFRISWLAWSEVKARAEKAKLDMHFRRNFLKVARIQAVVRGYLTVADMNLRYAAIDTHVREYAMLRLAPCLIRFAKLIRRRHKHKQNMCALMIQHCWKSSVMRKRRAKEVARKGD